MLDASDQSILKAMQRSGGVTVQDVCAAIDVTATAARHRLGRLIEFGYVDREAVNSGRGRPHHRYALTNAGYRELGDNYAQLAMVLWRAIGEISEPEVRDDILGRIRASMVDAYSGESAPELPMTGRFEQLARRMNEAGLDVEVDDSGDLPILRETNCPYHELASEDDGICELEQSVFAEVLGTGVVRSQCCLDGGDCCEFVPLVEG